MPTVGLWGWLNYRTSETESNSTTLRNMGLIFGGALALLFGVWRGLIAERQVAAAQRQVENAQRQVETAQRQAETAQQSFLNERYQRGAEMLGSEVLSVRLGGIYALERLAKEHPEQYHIQVTRLFCAFVRNPPGADKNPVFEYAENEPTGRLREDVQAVITAIGGRSQEGLALENAEEDFYLDLREATLHGASLQGANLAGAHLLRAELGRADLRGADLSQSKLGFANMELVNLMDAKLSGADLFGANLFRTTLSNTDFSHAGLYGVNLSGALLKLPTPISDPGGDAKGLSVLSLTQSQLNQARADLDNPPNLNGVLDSGTGEPLVWRGEALL